MFWPGTFCLLLKPLGAFVFFLFLTHDFDFWVPPDPIQHKDLYEFTVQNKKKEVFFSSEAKEWKGNETSNFVSWKGNFQIS